MLKIVESSVLESCYLQVDHLGVAYRKTALFGGMRRFAFAQIECILLSPSNVLSFQVGNEVLSVRTKADNAVHQEAIDTLVREVRRAHEDGRPAR